MAMITEIAACLRSVVKESEVEDDVPYLRDYQLNDPLKPPTIYDDYRYSTSRYGCGGDDDDDAAGVHHFDFVKDCCGFDDDGDDEDDVVTLEFGFVESLIVWKNYQTEKEYRKCSVTGDVLPLVLLMLLLLFLLLNVCWLLVVDAVVFVVVVIIAEIFGGVVLAVVCVLRGGVTVVAVVDDTVADAAAVVFVVVVAVVGVGNVAVARSSCKLALVLNAAPYQSLLSSVQLSNTNLALTYTVPLIQADMQI
ncbi:hypothetical protein FF38_08889 [Lucilia cuprina]|uniref:Uncharacterized protein n=1 Tax=Lucilia cuprina TaxID=7375 RepID=A0A0L0BWU8_LUCCU|nr:hypothetical protein FF38_08889 [Lucilia cuprina]